MTLKVALIDVGAMGGAIGARLFATGQSLSVFDLDGQKVAELTALGAKAASSAAASDFVIASLNAAHVIDITVFGKSGMAQRAKPGTLIIDMSSIDPEAIKTLAAKAQDAGLHWVVIPLSGGALKVAARVLTPMVGGRGVDVEVTSTGLKDVVNNYTHMRPVGAGQTTKLINQVLCGLNFMAVAEATPLALDTGVDAAKIPHALRGGSTDSVTLQEYMPRYVSRDYRRTGRIDNMVEDLIGAQDLAAEPIPPCQ